MRIPFASLVAGLVAYAPAAGAMAFHADPPYLYLSQRVVATDWDAWEEAMIKFDGKIKAVVFDHSPGGHSITGRKIGADIRQRGLTTVVAGRCTSACANMFLGGTQRLFTAKMHAQPTVLGYHGTYDRRTHALVAKRPPDYFLAMTDGKMSEELVARFTSLENRRGLLYFIHPNQQNKDNPTLAFFCRGDENPNMRDVACESLKDIDALSTGVVTSWDAANVPEPPRPWPTKGTAKNWD